MDKADVRKIAVEIEKSNSVFADKSKLDTLTQPTKIVGREDKIRELVSYLLAYKKGHVMPFISVYGRSGSGKSTIVRFVCETLAEEGNEGRSEISFEFVNLRKARTIFGCTNLILAALGMPQLKSPQGMNLAISQISKEVEKRIQTTKKLFVLVLDEFDVIFNDEHSSPSDFIFKLVDMHQELKQKGLLMTVIAISNDLMSSHGHDDRIKSRIGSAEIFFEPYSRREIFSLLDSRASEAFSDSVGPAVLETIADASCEEHGDARRAIELLRLSGEVARIKGDSKILTAHLLQAFQEQKKDRVTTILSTAPAQLKAVCAALAKLTFLAKNKESSSWYTTADIVREYETVLGEFADLDASTGQGLNSQDELRTLAITPLSYRRLSDRLVELKNYGLIEGRTQSSGRNGYASRYRLTERPEVIGKTISEAWWSKVEVAKLEK